MLSQSTVMDVNIAGLKIGRRNRKMPQLDWNKERIRKKKSISAWNNNKEYWQLFKEGLEELENSPEVMERTSHQDNPKSVHRILRNANNKLDKRFLNPHVIKRKLKQRKRYINIIKSKGWHEKDEFQELINFIPYHVALERDALAAKERKKQRKEINKQRKLLSKIIVQNIKEQKNVHIQS